VNLPFRLAFPLTIPWIFVLVLASGGVFAATTGISDQELRQELYDSLRKQGPDDEPSRPFSLVNRGGVSLGVYEAGVNWAVLRLLKDLRDDPAVSSRLRPDLYAAAGASAGAINGFIAGLFWCTEPGAFADPGTDALNSNLFRNSWRSIDVNKLIDHENDNLPEDDAAFSRVLVREVQAMLLGELESRDFRAGCEVAFGLSLTRSNPVLVSNAGVDIAQQRLVLPMTMIGTPQGDLQLKNFRMPTPSFSTSDPQKLANRPFLSSVIYLDSSAGPAVLESPLTPEAVFDAIKASSSFPVAFASMKLSYCIVAPETLRASKRRSEGRAGPHTVDERCPENYRRLSSYFVDGGVFDNDPLELVRQLSEQRQRNEPGKAMVRYVKIDPDKRRPAKGLFRFEVPQYAQSGDSLEISLWAGGPGNNAGEAAERNVTVRHCRADSDARTWNPLKDYRLTLIETSENSNFFIGTLHTRPSTGEKATSLRMADIVVRSPDRLLVFDPEEEFEPLCDPTKQSEEEQDKARNRTISIVVEMPPGLSTQLGFIGGSITSARGYRLHDELMRNNWHDGVYDAARADSRPLIQPARLTPLVGDFLFSFAAFIDERFRDFDYYAGVYDAVYGMAEFICISSEGPVADRNECRARFANKIYLQLCAPGGTADRVAACRDSSPNANAVLYQLIVLEICGTDDAAEIFSESCDLGYWRWIEGLLPSRVGENWSASSRELLLIGATLQKSNTAVEHTGRDSFVHFVKSLAKYRGEFLEKESELFERMMTRSDRPVATWYYPLSRNFFPQLLKLEDQDKKIRDGIGVAPAEARGIIKPGLALGGLFSESVMEDPRYWLLDQTSVPEHAERRLLASLFPSEFALDPRNGGWGLYWRPAYRMSNNWGVDFRLSPYVRQGFGAGEMLELAEATAFLTLRLENPLISSLGVGPTYTHTWGTDLSSDDQLGASAALGLLADKLKLTYGIRSFGDDEFADDDVYWHIGINDLPGIFYWACRGVDEAPAPISWLCDVH
jgi:hypothetical protein